MCLLVLVAAVLVQLVRVLKRTFEDKQEEEGQSASIPLPDIKRVRRRESRGPSEQQGVTRPVMEAFPATRRPSRRIEASAPNMRQGIILMTILEPCRGCNPFVFRS